MGHIVPDEYQNLYITTLIKVKSFDVVDISVGHEAFMIQLNKEVRILYHIISFGSLDGIDIKTQFDIINKMIDGRYSKLHHLGKSDILEFRVRFNEYISGYNSSCNPNFEANQPSNKNGKLMKYHICPICNVTFESNRSNAKFCSDRCRTAACRARKNPSN